MAVEHTGKVPRFFEEVEWCGAFLVISYNRSEKIVTYSRSQGEPNIPVHSIKHFYWDKSSPCKVQVW